MFLNEEHLLGELSLSLLVVRICSSTVGLLLRRLRFCGTFCGEVKELSALLTFLRSNRRELSFAPPFF